jgi:hypothetical protein
LNLNFFIFIFFLTFWAGSAITVAPSRQIPDRHLHSSFGGFDIAFSLFFNLVVEQQEKHYPIYCQVIALRTSRSRGLCGALTISDRHTAAIEPGDTVLHKRESCWPVGQWGLQSLVERKKKKVLELGTQSVPRFTRPCR